MLHEVCALHKVSHATSLVYIIPVRKCELLIHTCTMYMHVTCSVIDTCTCTCTCRYSISPKKVKVCAVRYGYGTVLVR